MYLDLKTEYSFGAVYGPLDKLASFCSTYAPWAGIADKNGSWGHIKWAKSCKQANIKPIYGVSLTVVEDDQMKVRRCARAEVILIAMNKKGLSEIYKLIDLSYKQFYYFNRISYLQINKVSKNIAVIIGPGYNINLLKRHAYVRLRPNDSFYFLSSIWKKQNNLDPIASIDNYYIDPEDIEIYEPFADKRKKENKTGPQFILTYDQWVNYFYNSGMAKIALENMKKVGNKANAKLSVAPMIKYKEKIDLKKICIQNAKIKKIDLKNKIYKDRLNKELKLIYKKEFVDYFLVVADLVKYAKTKMIVGPSRGSAAGSLVCYLLGITEIDPIKYDLYFERFIDINREDVPDIDIDFQDNKRYLAIKYLKNKYGENNISQISNISRLKPKSALTRFAKALLIPLDDVDNVKEAVPHRLVGDSRASLCLTDTFNTTKEGKDFIDKYPNMKIVEDIEGHVSHTSIHAGGILICNKPLINYVGINSRNKDIYLAMADKKDIEEVNLLKIDVLGLRTLTIFADICDILNKPYKWIYNIPLNDKNAYKVFHDHRFTSIFQFEGDATTRLAKQVNINSIYVISDIVSLSRPGPLVSGSADAYIKTFTKKEKIKYISNNQIIKDVTKETLGGIIYQEQVIKILHEYGQLSWPKTNELRIAIGKSLSSELFDKHKKEFIKGAIKNGDTEEDALKVWDYIHTYGSYGFNKAHSIAYSWISYLCAYFKAYYPLHFAVACLNNAKDDRSALKLLRELYELENINYIPFDIKKCQERWTVQNGKLYAGLITLHGIGPANAKKIIKLREKGEPLPPGIQKHIDNLNSPFLYLYPGEELYGDYYKNPKKYKIKRKVSYISDLNKKGKYIILGCLVEKKLLDLNDVYYVTKRNGKYLNGNTSFLKIKLEDDTDNITCIIDRDLYLKLGQNIVETGKEEKDWYLVYGEFRPKFRTLNVLNIKRITR